MEEQISNKVITCPKCGHQWFVRVSGNCIRRCSKCGKQWKPYGKIAMKVKTTMFENEILEVLSCDVGLTRNEIMDKIGLTATHHESYFRLCPHEPKIKKYEQDNRDKRTTVYDCLRRLEEEGIVFRERAPPIRRGRPNVLWYKVETPQISSEVVIE